MLSNVRSEPSDIHQCIDISDHNKRGQRSLLKRLDNRDKQGFPKSKLVLIIGNILIVLAVLKQQNNIKKCMGKCMRQLTCFGKLLV